MRLFNRNIGFIIGALLCVGLGWWLYLTFFAPLPRWGAMPHEAKRIPLPDIWQPLDIIALPATNAMYIVSLSDKVVIFKNDELLSTASIGHQLIPSLEADTGRNRVYVTNGQEDTVTLLEGISKTTTIPVGGTHPEDIAINPKTGLAYVIGRGESEPGGPRYLVWNNYLTVLDGATVLETLYFKQSSFQKIAVDPINDYLYIGARKELKNDLRGDIIIFKDLQEVARVELLIPPKDLEVDPHTGDVYALAGTPDLSLFQNGRLVSQINVGPSPGTPTDMALHPVTGDLYIIDFSFQEMVVVRDMTVLARLPLGWDPAHMAIDPLTGNVYVANARDNTVTVINGTELLGTIDVGWYPYGIGVNPNNGLVYVSNTNENSISILGFEK